ncbi:nuclear transport factor 2 family protein [Nonomuraea sp. B12E4]|uniref:nuclear transport factor 2 family protein n=1 Tax=Nonomuraea sp. B12E4 TaxID=3153564 RepID=UPI00325F6101
MSSAREMAERFLDTPIGGGLADLYAEDSVIEIPFVPEGVPTRFEGREGHRDRFERAARTIRRDRVDNVVIHETADPEVVVLEYDLHSTLIGSGRPVVLSYIMVMRVRDGLIVHSRDYGNPLAAARFREELVGELKSEQT